MAATSNAIRHLFLALNSYLYSFYCYPNSKASLNASPAQQSKHIILLRNATRNTVYDSLDKHWPNTVKKAYMVLSYWHGSANALNLAVGISGLEEDPAPLCPYSCGCFALANWALIALTARSLTEWRNGLENSREV